MALLGVSARHHHHHHQASLADVDYMMTFGEGEGEGKKSWTPADSRKLFEKQVAEAANVVKTQQAFEKAKVADVAARNAKDTAEANALKLKVRRAANENLMGRTKQQPEKQLWTGYEVGLVQIPDAHNQRLLEIELSEEPKEAAAKEPAATEPDALADAPKADAPVPDAPKVQSNTQPVGTPQYSYEAKMNARSLNAEVLGRQKKQEAAWNKEHDEAMDKAAKEAAEAKGYLYKEAAIRRQGGMTYGERALTQ